VSFDVPGFFDVAVVFRTEHNHNWYATYAQFGGAGCVPSATQVCNPDIGSKGRDGVGAHTKPETLLESSLMVDVGSFFGKKDTVFVGVGYQYWHNKFGSDSDLD